MIHPVNRTRIFLASCLALVTMALTFAVRCDILSALGLEFDLSHQRQGLILAAAAWGYPMSILVVGPFCDHFGMGRLLRIAFVGHVTGILLTLASPALGFPVLLAACFILSLTEGVVEGVINPLVATLYPRDKTGRINLLHASWPLGLVVGGLFCVAVTAAFRLDVPGVTAAAISLSWRVKFALILLPALGYGFLLVGQPFPQTERAASGVSMGAMIRETVHPGFLILVVCMAFTAATEMGPDAWLGSVMTDTVGMRGITFLVYTAVIMFVFRIWAGALVRRYSPFGVLTASCLLAAGGLFWLSHAFTPAPAFAAATVFAVGLSLLWPVLLGVATERFPKSGALGLALLSATGALGGGLAGPVMGTIYDRYTVRNLPPGVASLVVVDGRYSPVAKERLDAPADLAAVRAAERAGASMSFRWVSVLPLFPLLVYVPLIFWHRSRGGYRPLRLSRARPRPR
ncbi:MAG: MFS transporter [Candidatus Coatesbacteria bacterium]